MTPIQSIWDHPGQNTELSSSQHNLARVEPCCSNMADNEYAIVLACTSSVVFMLLCAQIPFVPSNQNYINVYFNKLVNNLHIITLYKLHNKLSCKSHLSCRTCRAIQARCVECVEACCSTSFTQPECMGLTTSNVSRRDEPSGIWALQRTPEKI